jgi:CDP-4-dehydro-6-deoxyglucose reductase, E3
MNALSLSRAARLAGVTRAEIQRRIRAGELPAFEGSVTVGDLLRVYPDLVLEREDALARVERIKALALPSRRLDAVLPPPEVLVGRLRGLSEALATKRSALAAAETLLDQVEAGLAALAAGPAESAPCPDLESLRDWLAEARRQSRNRPADDPAVRLYAMDTALQIMAANVRLLPSGHDFFVEGKESILEAAVRAGVHLNYGCASGTCGQCRARVLSGEVAQIHRHDYVLGARERAQGDILTCSWTAVSDLVLEAVEARGADALPRQDIRAGVRRLEALGPDLLSLQLQTPRTQTLRFLAGQRVRLTLDSGASHELPLANCPCDGRNLWFFVRRGADPFATAVFTDLCPGDPIRVEGPWGDCVLDEESPDPAVFIALGDGIAPIKSLIEHAVSIDRIESLELWWGTTRSEGHHQGHWARALTESLDNFQYRALSHETPQDLLADLAATCDPGSAALGGARYYLAGPDPLLERLRSGLAERGVEAGRVRWTGT